MFCIRLHRTKNIMLEFSILILNVPKKNGTKNVEREKNEKRSHLNVFRPYFGFFWAFLAQMAPFGLFYPFFGLNLCNQGPPLECARDPPFYAQISAYFGLFWLCQAPFSKFFRPLVDFALKWPNYRGKV